MVVDEVPPDGHGVTASPERREDQLSIGLARAPGRRATGRGTGAESVDTSAVVADFAPSESVDTAPEMAGFAGPGSVDTDGGEVAGFALDSLGRPRPRTGILSR